MAERLRTRVFQYKVSAGFRTDKELAQAMGISQAVVSRTLTYELDPRDEAGQPPSVLFIQGALRAFLGKTFEDLFYVEADDREPAAVS